MISQNMSVTSTQFAIGQVVKHRIYEFRGVIVDVDPEFNNTEEWWLAIPENLRPRKNQPFYHLLAENESTSYEAYVSEQNLLIDDTGEPINHPQVAEVFGETTLAVVMTGMGNDGLLGCKCIQQAGGQILAQDEQTSVVWGMPGQVARAGLADDILPLDKLGPEIARRVRRRR